MSDELKDKPDWWKDANYIYEAVPKKGRSNITFSFPHTPNGKFSFTTWLYKYYDLDGTTKIRDTNYAAEILQSYIDRDITVARKAAGLEPDND